MRKQAQMYKVKATVTFREEAGQLKREREKKKSGEKGIFSLQEREIRAEKTGAGRAGRCTDQLMNITELTHPVAWNA